MNSNNNANVSGYIGRTPRFIAASGDMQAVLYFSVGVNRQPGKRDDEGMSTGATDWVDCTVYGTRAEKLASLLKQGQGVNVLGAFRSKVEKLLTLAGQATSRTITSLVVEDINVFHYGKDSASEPATADESFTASTVEEPVEQF